MNMSRNSGGATTLALLAVLVGLVACAQKAAAPKTMPADPRVDQFAKLPDWRGIWIVDGGAPEINGFPGPESQGKDPYKLVGGTAPWNDVGRRKFEAVMKAQGNRKANGWGYPMMMSGSAPLQFLITPEETLIINMYRDTRHVYTDGRGHPAAEDRWATTWGDSVGHWEGDTLVIDTLSVRDPLRFFFFVPPLSEQAHYVERLRKSGPDRIESEITIEDPENLSKPWVEKLAYVRAPGLDRMIHDDYDNDRSEVKDGVFTIEPPKD